MFLHEVSHLAWQTVININFVLTKMKDMLIINSQLVKYISNGAYENLFS